MRIYRCAQCKREKAIASPVNPKPAPRCQSCGRKMDVVTDKRPDSRIVHKDAAR